MKILTVNDIQTFIRKIDLAALFKHNVAALKEDFGQWQDFSLSSRIASYYPHGLIELMTCCDQHLYSFKYVNGHPGNPMDGKLTVAAIGALSNVASGYPLMIRKMTLLTAFRPRFGKSVFPAYCLNLSHSL